MILLNLHSDDENYCRDIQIKSHYEQMAQSRWATRGWTYQEHILSKRVVCFLDDRVFWECSRSVWDMHGLSSGMNTSGGPTIADLGMRLMTTTWPDFSLYVDLTCPYNGRDLTYSGDGLSACSGILNRLTRSFLEGFIYGLPRGRFDDALLWQPIRGCHRRFESGTETDSPLPSWSWCGWQCYVDPRSFLSGDSAFQAPMAKPITSSWTTQKCVFWNVLTYRGEKVPITEYVESDITPQLVCKTERASFYIADILRVTESPSHKLRGGRLEAFGHPVLTDKPLNEMAPIMVLQDKDGVFSGLLRATADVECNQGDMIELITISKGSANRCDIEGCIEERLFGKSQDYGSEPFQVSFDANGLWVDDPSGKDRDFYQIEYEGDDVPELKQVEEYWGDHDTCQFHNVLWVQKKESICYRVACGRIEERVWKSNQRGETEVILG
ncbi:heterokaryon incompatibility protein [Fusarium mundagurra]|uniref:Heterokaryon incompatibility protein n=1 Tax=Fusarium mundagurra TaxID=1567541 RepID=A0A8H6DG33_9HYPO|nr:heterokaryon incompatibility protein [Fusarium mundagurra]